MCQAFGREVPFLKNKCFYCDFNLCSVWVVLVSICWLIPMTNLILRPIGMHSDWRQIWFKICFSQVSKSNLALFRLYLASWQVAVATLLERKRCDSDVRPLRQPVALVAKGSLYITSSIAWVMSLSSVCSELFRLTHLFKPSWNYQFP